MRAGCLHGRWDGRWHTASLLTGGAGGVPDIERLYARRRSSCPEDSQIMDCTVIEDEIRML